MTKEFIHSRGRVGTVSKCSNYFPESRILEKYNTLKLILNFPGFFLSTGIAHTHTQTHTPNKQTNKEVFSYIVLCGDFSLGNHNYLRHVLPAAARNAFRALFLNTLDLEVHMQPFLRCGSDSLVSLATDVCV